MEAKEIVVRNQIRVAVVDHDEDIPPIQARKTTAVKSPLVAGKDTWLRVAFHEVANLFAPRGDCSTEPELEELSRTCFRRFRTWRIPANWSRKDWREEILQVAAASACDAACHYDSKSDARLCACIHGQVKARIQTRYRQQLLQQ